MRVTVLISTRNNVRRLEVTLDSLSRLRIPSDIAWDLVVADNGSSDGTARVLGEWASRLPLRSVWVPEPGLSRGRNAALALARGHLVIFTDDDVKVPATWITQYTEAFKALGDRYFYGGPIDSELEGDPPADGWMRIAPASVRGLEWGTTAHELKGGEYFTGANWACSPDAARAAGGYDIRMGLGGTGGPLGGEENDLMERLHRQGLRGWYLPAVRIQHWVPASKTKPEHLLARWEALATVKAWKGHVRYGRIKVGRIPWRLYPELAKATLKSLAARLGLADRVEADTQRAWARGAWAGFRLPPP